MFYSFKHALSKASAATIFMPSALCWIVDFRCSDRDLGRWGREQWQLGRYVRATTVELKCGWGFNPWPPVLLRVASMLGLWGRIICAPVKGFAGHKYHSRLSHGQFNATDCCKYSQKPHSHSRHQRAFPAFRKPTSELVSMSVRWHCRSFS